jgi:hypothetical protein
VLRFKSDSFSSFFLLLLLLLLSFQSVGDSTVWALSHDAFSKYVVEHPQVGLGFLEALALQVRSQSKLIRSLGQDGEVKEGVIKVIFFDTKKWVVDAFDAQKKELGLNWLEIKYVSQRLATETAYFAAGYQVVCCFVNDTIDSGVARTLRYTFLPLLSLPILPVLRLRIHPHTPRLPSLLSLSQQLQ